MATLPEVLAIALEHHQAGRLAEAEQIYRHILAVEPHQAEALHLLGVIAHQAGRHEVAVQYISRAIGLKATQAVFHNNLGEACRALRNTAQAVACYRRALELKPDYAEAHNNLGIALEDAGEPLAAVSSYRRALELNPDYAEAHNNLANVLGDMGKLDEAVFCCRRALELNADLVEGHTNLAAVLTEQGRLDEAVACCRRALQLKPDYAEAHNNLGVALKAQGKLDEAVAGCRRALELKPDYVEAHLNLGNALKDQGRLDEAIACCRQALALKPDYTQAHSNLAYSQLFCPGYDAQSLYEEHRRWNRDHAASLTQFVQPPRNDRSPERRLRVGYVSPDFRDHVVGRNLLPLLREHDHERFEIVCYAGGPGHDELTGRFQGYADGWCDTADLTDRQLAQRIGADRIDILVDTTLHMARNRLLVFARRPAPVQVTFAGYPGSTGLSAIDYRLTDPHLDPPDLFDRFYSEKSVRLPDSFWCYDPPDDEAEVSALPAAGKGYVTFGCLNNFCKINAPVLKLWAQVLKNVDRSRLVMLAHDGTHRRHTLDLLAAEGVAPDRVTFVANQARPQYLRCYHGIDVGLDTVPYNGHTTSLDSLWMGVPVVTLVGPTVVGRAGLSQLTNLGLAELISHTPERFVSVAVDLAADLPRLARLRATLRGRMERSPLMDAPRFARGIEAAYRQMWRRWCAGAAR